MRFTVLRADKVLAIACALALAGPAAAQLPPQGSIEPDGTLTVPETKLPQSDFVGDEFSREYARYVQDAGNWPHAPAIDAPKAEWDQFDTAADRDIYGPGYRYSLKTYPVDVTETTIAGVHAAIVVPKGGVRPENRDEVLINFHGGGFFMGRGLIAGLAEAIPVASMAGMRVITVDYRMAPFFTYPAASEDSEAVYRALLKDYKPAQIGVFGCSAGGMLTGQSVAWYRAKHLPRPGAVGMFCWAPAAFGKRGDSSVWSLTGVPWTRPFEVDAMKLLRGKGYMTGIDVADSRAYPGSSDDELATFPPTLLVTGTRAAEMSSAVVAHARFLKLGVDSQLYVIEGGQHGSLFSGEYGAPETRDVFEYIGRWFATKLAK